MQMIVIQFTTSTYVMIPLPKKDRTEFYINLPNIIHNTLQQKHAANCPAYMSYNCPQLSYICGMALMR